MKQILYKVIGVPVSWVLKQIAILTGSYGLAILVVTCLARGLMVLGNYKGRKTTRLNVLRMRSAKEELDQVNQEIEVTKSDVILQVLEKDRQGILKKYGIEEAQSWVGCLGMFVQLWFISAIYIGVTGVNEINQATFLGIELGKPSMILSVIVGVVYAIQILVTSYTSKQFDPKFKIRWIQAVLPLIFGWIAWQGNGGVALYLLASILVQLIFDLYMTVIGYPKLIKEEENRLSQVAKFPKREPRVDCQKMERYNHIHNKYYQKVNTLKTIPETN